MRGCRSQAVGAEIAAAGEGEAPVEGSAMRRFWIGRKGMRQSGLYFSRRRHIREVPGVACSRNIACLFTALSMLSACATGGRPQRASVAGAEEAVRSTELAFAKAMADRDFKAFVSPLSDDALFFDDRKIQHGATEVSAAWKPLFSDEKGPFSWETA